MAANGSLAVAVPAGRTLVVGRSPACDVTIRDLTVSRHHGEIEAAEAGLRIRDLGSTNGTFVNGSRINEAVAVPGSRVSFGKIAFQVLEEQARGGAGSAEDDASHRVRVVGQMRAQSTTDVSSLLALEGTPPPSSASPGSGTPASAPSSGSASATGTAGSGIPPVLRVRGETATERRVTALSLLLEVAKELSQQGDTGRLFDKAARLALQALAVDRVDILTIGDGDEMVARVSKSRPGAPVRETPVPRLAARKAVLERAAVLVEEPFDAARSGIATGSAAIRTGEAAAGGGAGGAGGEAGAAAVSLSGSAALSVASHLVAPNATTDAVQIVVDFDRAHDSRDAKLGGSGSVSMHPAAAAAAENARGNAICAPLLGMQGTVLGMLYLDTAQPRALGRDELQFVAALAAIIAVSLENLWLMERARDEAVAKAGYQRHFGPFVAEQVAATEGGGGVPALRRRVACLSCELRGFTATAAEMEAGAVARLLGELFSELVELVFEHSGTLCSLTGTGLTAIWGAPLSRTDDADEAVAATMAMQRAAERLNSEWQRQGGPQVALAAGLDLGDAFTASIGSERRQEFAAIGKPVETAARLSAAAAGGEMLVSEALLAALAAPPPVDAAPGEGHGGSAPGQPGQPAYRIDWRTPPTLRQSGEVQAHTEERPSAAAAAESLVRSGGSEERSGGGA